MKWQSVIEQIHQSDLRIVLAVTGGGSRAISDLVCAPGASRTVLQSIVTYASAATREWLGHEPDSYCSRQTALNMASVGWWKGRRLLEDDSESDQVVGLACTAALASDRPKRGDHRCHLGVQTSHETRYVTLTFEKGKRARIEEEKVVRDLLLSELARLAKIEEGIPEIPLSSSETLEVDSARADESLADVISGRRDFVWSLSESQNRESDCPRAILSGSFNPLHDGHRELRQTAEQHLACEVAYELPIVNADKPPLDFLSIRDRRRQFEDSPLLISAAPRFIEKARVFPGTTFVIGADTALRVIDPRFYDGRRDAMDGVLTEIREAGCRFLVAGRLVDGTFVGRDQLDLPSEFAELFDFMPESEFRRDISSTSLRRASR